MLIHLLIWTIKHIQEILLEKSITPTKTNNSPKNYCLSEFFNSHFTISRIEKLDIAGD